MILLSGLQYLTQTVVGNMTNGQAGTSSTLFLKSQTGLQTAVGASELSLIDKTNTVSQVSVTYQLSVSQGNGNVFTEYEVNDGTNSYNRVVKAPTSKTALIELTVVHTFDFEIVV
jgi:hypothetical protein